MTDTGNLGKGEIMNSEIKIRVETDRGFKYIHMGHVSSGEKFWEELQEIIRHLFE